MDTVACRLGNTTDTKSRVFIMHRLFVVVVENHNNKSLSCYNYYKSVVIGTVKINRQFTNCSSKANMQLQLCGT